MHQHELNDHKGDLIAVVPFCCNRCHAEWDRNHGYKYEGWNGCHEGGDNEYCANCGVIASTGPDSCECQRMNIVVNRFISEEGETCEHGNWIQLPMRLL